MEKILCRHKSSHTDQITWNAIHKRQSHTKNILQWKERPSLHFSSITWSLSWKTISLGLLLKDSYWKSKPLLHCSCDLTKSCDLFSEKYSDGIAFKGLKMNVIFHCTAFHLNGYRVTLKRRSLYTVLSHSWWCGMNSSEIWKCCIFYNTSTHLLLLSSLLFVGGTSVSGLQRSLHECDGFCGHDLSSGVHVPCHSSTAHLHGFSRTGTVTCRKNEEQLVSISSFYIISLPASSAF